MAQKKIKILVIFDAPFAIEPLSDHRLYMKGRDWKDERDVINTLKKLGHQVKALGILDSIQPLLDAVSGFKPDVVFNLCESFRADRAHEPNLTALLELLGVPYTGAKPEALAICKDKGMTKKILSFHDIKVPGFVTSQDQKPLRLLPEGFSFPAICKPLGLDASEGITQASLVDNEKDCLGQIRHIHKKFHTDVIVEEYIDGRELYVGVFGNDRLTALPPTELTFKRLPSRTPRMLTYKAKWDETYRKKYGIDSDRARNLDAAVEEQILSTCKEIYRLLKLSGYARIDLRLDENLEPYCIEVNPNPSIKKNDDFAWAARRAGMDYEDLLAKIVNLALAG